jgi:RNA polymerase sigma factor (sigma-70 family)
LPIDSRHQLATVGPPSRLADWFRDLQVPLRRFISRRRGLVAADVDDVAQEVFLRLLRFDQAELIYDPKSYLYKVAANVASEWSMRARARLPHAAEWLDDLEDGASSPTDNLERESRDAALSRAVASLPPRAREVLRLQFSEGLTREAISKHLNVSQRIVKRDIVSAYTRLRVLLQEQVDQRIATGTTQMTKSGGLR